MAKSKGRFLADLIGATGLVRSSKSDLAGADGIIELSVLPSLPNSKLTNTGITLGGTTIALGASSSTLGAIALTGPLTTNSTIDGIDIATRDGILSSTTTTAGAALPKAGGAMTGAITTNSTFDGRDVAADGVTADAALPKAGGAMTGAITTNSTFDGVDIAVRDAVLTSTTTTANAAAPLNNPTLTGTPAAPTASGSTSTTQLATTAFVQQELTTLIGGAPSTLNDLNELAAAINDDANYNSTLTTALATKAPLASPTFTGTIKMQSNGAYFRDGVGNSLSSGWDATGDDHATWINFEGYQGGTTKFRDLRIGNGKQAAFVHFDGSAASVAISGALTATGLTVDTSAGQLDVEALGGSSVKVKSDGSLKIEATGGSVSLINGSTEVLSTTSTGVTVAGTVTIPDYVIHSGNTSTKFGFGSANTMNFISNGSDRLTIANSFSVFNNAGTDYDFRVKSNDNDNMLFVDGGNNRVGIGGTASETLHVYGRSRIQNLLLGEISSNLDVIQALSSAGLFLVGGGTTATIGTAGATFSSNVGIGVAPTFSAGGNRRLLQLTNGASGGLVAMGNNSSESENPRIFSDADNLGFATSTTGGGIFQFYTANTERMRISSSGNVSMTVDLTVGNSYLSNNYASFANMRINNNAYIGSAHTPSAVQIQTGGAVAFGYDVTVPNISVADDIGHTGDADTYLSFENNYLGMYAGGNLNLALSASGASIKLGGSGAANTLDDYEEGTFTATLHGATEPATLQTRVSTYTKIGRLVSFTIGFENQTTTGYSNAIWFTGLPFTCIGARTVVNIIPYIGITWPAGQLTAKIEEGTTKIDAMYIQSNTAWGAASHNAGVGRYFWITGQYETNS